MLHRSAFLALILAYASAAEAQLDQRALNGALRTQEITLEDFQFAEVNNPDLAATSSTPATPHASGVNGIVFATTLSFSSTVGVSGGCPRNDGAACTSSIGAMPYPAKLVIQLLDNTGGDNVITCLNTRGDIAGGVTDPNRFNRAMIRGVNQFGVAVSERIPALTEAARFETVNAYERVDRIDLTGCAGGGGQTAGTADQLVVAPSTAIAVPFKINVSTAEIAKVFPSICRHARATTVTAGELTTTNQRCVVGTQTACPSGASTCGLDVDKAAHTIDFRLMNFAGAGPPVNGQRIVIRGRAPTTGF